MSRPSTLPSVETGAKGQAIGPSREGQTTRALALAETIGRTFALAPTPRNIADVTVAPGYLSGPAKLAVCVPTKGFGADALRISVCEAGAVPVMPGRAGRKRPIHLDRPANATDT